MTHTAILNEDLTAEAPAELTPEQIEVFAAVEELVIKGRDYKPESDAIVPPDCEFDGPGEDEDFEGEEYRAEVAAEEARDKANAERADYDL